MGCCFSRQNGPNSPYPGGAPSASSARAINPPTATQQAEPANDVPDGNAGQRTRRSRQPLSQHINKPLRKHTWKSKGDNKWTRSTIDQQRTEFFDTRVTGNVQVWQTIRAALEIMWEADLAAQRATSEGLQDASATEADRAVALATAQSILNAADVTLPTGNLKNGVYDSLGSYYSLPEFVVSDPTNICPDTDTEEAKFAKGGLTDNDATGDEGELDEDELEQRREEKGKGVAISEEQVEVCARLSEDGRDITLSIGKGRTVKVLVRRVAEAAELPRETRIRIAYLGKILKDDLPLIDQGWKPGHIINALMFEQHQ